MTEPDNTQFVVKSGKSKLKGSTPPPSKGKPLSDLRWKPTKT